MAKATFNKTYVVDIFEDALIIEGLTTLMKQLEQPASKQIAADRKSQHRFVVKLRKKLANLEVLWVSPDGEYLEVTE